MQDDLIEVLAERSHIGWMKEKQAQGFANHVWKYDPTDPLHGACFSFSEDGRRCRLDGLKHHPDMVPYADLAENVKDYDRATVRGVLDGIEEAGYTIVKADENRVSD